MNKLMTAVAFAIALPGAAHAQAAPAEKPKMECCEKMAGKTPGSTSAPSDDPHAGHDMKPDAAPAGGHAHH